MQHLWAPWRGEYVSCIDNEKKDTCVLCDLFQQKCSKDNLLIYKGSSAFVVMNKYPYNNGHIMVVPNAHINNFKDLSDKEYTYLSFLLKKAVEIIYLVFNPEGCNIGMNMGRVAGAGLDKHLHYHIVPRWNGDTNFMPVLTDVKIISEHILLTYQKLYDAFLEVNDNEI